MKPLTSLLILTLPTLAATASLGQEPAGARLGLGPASADVAEEPAPAATGQAGWLAAGAESSCAVLRSGKVLCWGKPYAGGTPPRDVLTPADVEGWASGIAMVAVGGGHACALSTSGGLTCLGSNDFGQLGDGTTRSSTSPVNAAGLAKGVVAVAAGESHTCALLGNGKALCWGRNDKRQLGDGTSKDSPRPVEVAKLEGGAIAIAAGRGHSCAVTVDRGAACWGDNRSGQLGTAELNPPPGAAGVAGLADGLTAITTGANHTCALTALGGVKCWGENRKGQVSNGSHERRSFVPVDVPGLAKGVSAVSAGGAHSCAILKGGVKCWGMGESGQLATEQVMNSAGIVAIPGLESGVAAVSAGGFHTCALMKTGRVKCWGERANGRLGDGAAEGPPGPVDVTGL
ncbi:MAG: chromosome condensation regulator RCC1 [Elusimicrobia bacterium]|nr:chromosome condensation regulator RCC1 [Elusimicrobiota bacterium]